MRWRNGFVMRKKAHEEHLIHNIFKDYYYNCIMLGTGSSSEKCRRIVKDENG